MIDLVDTHAHLQEAEFNDDRDAVVARARAAGVNQIVLPAVDLESAATGIELADAHDGVYATAGFHPHEASRLTADALATLAALLENPKVVAVGEIGLDWFRMHSPRKAQLQALEAQLELAAERALPVVIHCRDAWSDLKQFLAPWAQRVATAFEGRPLGVLHYFSSSVEDARHFYELGFLISVHTSVTHPKAQQLRDVVAALPLEALVVETDSPYGAPQAYRGKRNEPSYVVEAAKQVAELRQQSLEDVAAATSSNARRLFGLPTPGPAKLTGALI